MDKGPPQPDQELEHLIQINDHLTIIPPVRIDPTATIKDSTIGPYVYIGPNCVINDCLIKNSILSDHVYLSHLNAYDSIFGSNVEFSGSVTKKHPKKFIMGDKSSVKKD